MAVVCGVKALMVIIADARGADVVQPRPTNLRTESGGERKVDDGRTGEQGVWRKWSAVT